MAKQDRMGNRKNRSDKRTRKIELGYYFIVTDAEKTEAYYFEGLKESLPSEIQGKIEIKVQKSKRNKMISTCCTEARYDSQYRECWIVFDRDQVKNFDDIIKEAEKNKIKVGWSNPCIEIWFYAYFGTMPNIVESWNCCSKFEKEFVKRTKINYSKTDKLLYRKLTKHGNEDDAINIAKNKYDEHLRNKKLKPSEMVPCSTVYELVEEIKSKISNHINK